MSLAEMVLLSTALGADMFSALLPMGMTRIKKREILTSAAVFSLFHILMLLGGYFAGAKLAAVLARLGVGLAEGTAVFGAAVLLGLGMHILWDSRKADADVRSAVLLRGVPLLLLALGVSVDALAVGMGMGMIETDYVLLGAVLGAVIFVIAVSALWLGRRMGRLFARYAPIVGGGLLCLLAVRILWNI